MVGLKKLPKLIPMSGGVVPLYTIEGINIARTNMKNVEANSDF